MRRSHQAVCKTWRQTAHGGRVVEDAEPAHVFGAFGLKKPTAGFATRQVQIQSALDGTRQILVYGFLGKFYGFLAVHGVACPP